MTAFFRHRGIHFAPASASDAPVAGQPWTDSRLRWNQGGLLLAVFLVLLFGLSPALAPVRANPHGGGHFCGDGTVDASEDCDDGNVDNGDCCSSSCIYEYSGSGCNDNNPCTDSDSCDGSGTCSGTPISCTDSPGQCYESTGTCNTDTGACEYAPLSGSASCEDGDLCTLDDLCDGFGTCSPGPPQDCSDGNQCTSDSCNSSTGLCDNTVTPG